MLVPRPSVSKQWTRGTWTSERLGLSLFLSLLKSYIFDETRYSTVSSTTRRFLVRTPTILTCGCCQGFPFCKHPPSSLAQELRNLAAGCLVYHNSIPSKCRRVAAHPSGGVAWLVGCNRIKSLETWRHAKVLHRTPTATHAKLRNCFPSSLLFLLLDTEERTRYVECGCEPFVEKVR